MRNERNRLSSICSTDMYWRVHGNMCPGSYKVERKIMRNIEFRGLRKDNGEWAYGYLDWERLMEGGVAWDVHTGLDGIEFEEFYEVIPETVSQYTGLKDKNGRKIFEGDRIKAARCGFVPGLLEVVYDETKACWCLQSYHGNHRWALDAFNGEEDTFEVIGNIHEHEGLMKSQ